MTTQLIPVVSSVIGSQTVQTVDGRALHTFLEVQSHFRDWINNRIEEYGFEEGKDFRSFFSESTGGRPTKEYALTLNMGKELCILRRLKWQRKRETASDRRRFYVPPRKRE